MTIPQHLVTQLQNGYQESLVEFFVAQHDALCPLCRLPDKVVYVDPQVSPESVPWNAFAQDYLMRVVRPSLYAWLSDGAVDPVLGHPGDVINQQTVIQTELDVTTSAHWLFKEDQFFTANIEKEAVIQACNRIRHIGAALEHSHTQLEWLIGPAAEFNRRQAFDALVFRLRNDVREICRSLNNKSDLDTESLAMGSLSVTSRTLQPSLSSVRDTCKSSALPPQ